jgi:hypothetical protein
MFNYLLKNQKKKRKAWQDRLNEVEKRLVKEKKSKRKPSEEQAASGGGTTLDRVKGRLAEISKVQENLSRYTNQILKKSYVSLLSSSSYGDSLILSSMHSDVKIFTDKKVKGKQN